MKKRKKAKFKVGQVVTRRGRKYYQVVLRHRIFAWRHAYRLEGTEYFNKFWEREHELRPLTRREKGQP